MSGEFARVRSAFFDRDIVAKALERKTKKVFSKFGSYVRTSMQTSMRPGGSYAAKTAPAVKKRGRPKKTLQFSSPGSPPLTHDSKLLRKLLYFSYDAGNKSVVIGPLRLERTMDQHVPLVLDEGGIIHRRGQDGKMKDEHYAARPFKQAARDQNIGRVAEFYREA